MRYRNLGSTGISVSEIGFGTWGLGGDSYGPINDSVSQNALRLALDSGVTFYDTSDLYGNGHSEEILGATFHDLRQQIVIATKVGSLPHTGFYMPQDFSEKYIREAVTLSLRRLKTEYIDLYQLHSPPLDLPNWEEIVFVLQSLQREGQIRVFGISARSPADAKTAIERFGFDVVQVNFNLIDHRAIESGLFELCRRKNVGVIARTPLGFGYLTGRMTGDEELRERDHRANWPKEQLRRWAKTPGLFAPLKEGKSRTMVQLALQFCLSDDSVSTVIPGMMTCDEVRENVTVAKLPPLSQQELGEIRDIYQHHIFYDPTAKSIVETPGNR